MTETQSRLVVEGYCKVSKFMGVHVHEQDSLLFSKGKDIFTNQMHQFKGKKVRITVECLS